MCEGFVEILVLAVSGEVMSIPMQEDLYLKQILRGLGQVVANGSSIADKLFDLMVAAIDGLSNRRGKLKVIADSDLHKSSLFWTHLNGSKAEAS
jgi:hypothetical protein